MRTALILSALIALAPVAYAEPVDQCLLSTEKAYKQVPCDEVLDWHNATFQFTDSSLSLTESMNWDGARKVCNQHTVFLETGENGGMIPPYEEQFVSSCKVVDDHFAAIRQREEAAEAWKKHVKDLEDLDKLNDFLKEQGK